MAEMLYVQRMCKYGHGALVLQPSKFSMQEVADTTDGGGTIRSNLTGMLFSVRLARCPSCGYIEVIDDDAKFEP